jgi:hypothetical protein
LIWHVLSGRAGQPRRCGRLVSRFWRYSSPRRELQRRRCRCPVGPARPSGCPAAATCVRSVTRTSLTRARCSRTRRTIPGHRSRGWQHQVLCIRARRACRRLHACADAGHDARRAVSGPGPGGRARYVSGRRAPDPDCRVLPRSPSGPVVARWARVPARGMLSISGSFTAPASYVGSSAGIGDLTIWEGPPDSCAYTYRTSPGAASALIYVRSATPRSADTRQPATAAQSPRTAQAPCLPGGSAGSHMESPPTAPPGSAIVSLNTSLHTSCGHRPEVIWSERSFASRSAPGESWDLWQRVPRIRDDVFSR